MSLTVPLPVPQYFDSLFCVSDFPSPHYLLTRYYRVGGNGFSVTVYRSSSPGCSRAVAFVYRETGTTVLFQDPPATWWPLTPPVQDVTDSSEAERALTGFVDRLAVRAVTLLTAGSSSASVTAFLNWLTLLDEPETAELRAAVSLQEIINGAHQARAGTWQPPATGSDGTSRDTPPQPLPSPEARSTSRP